MIKIDRHTKHSMHHELQECEERKKVDPSKKNDQSLKGLRNVLSVYIRILFIQ